MRNGDELAQEKLVLLAITAGTIPIINPNDIFIVKWGEWVILDLC